MITTMRVENGGQMAVMRTTAGGSGFVKQDVLKMIDDLNVKLLSLEDQNSDLRQALKAAYHRITELEAARR